ncbi:MAG: hypothetical protein VB852_00435 [Deltaproteobacteria bacterium]
MAAIVFVLSAAPADAWDKGEMKCRATISKGLGKYVSTAQKAIGGCHKSRDKGKISSSKNCNDLSEADIKTKVPKAASKLRGSIHGAKSKCKDKKSGQVYTNVLANFERCPSPGQATDDGGATDGIDDFGELGDCLIALANAQVQQSARDIIGLPGPSSLSKGQLKCHGTLPKAYMKYIDTVAKERGKAQAGSDKAGGTAVWSQANYDGKGKIAKALAKAMGSVDKSCSGLSLAELNAIESCGDTPQQIKDCVETIADKQARGLVSSQFVIAPRCAAKVQIKSFAGTGVQLTNTGLDTGWTGMGHGVDILDGFIGQASFTGCDADCRNCGVELDPDKTQPWANCRCSNDYTQTCDTVAGPDADDCGGATCNCHFGPPLPLSAGGAPVCVMTNITDDLEGSVDQGTATAETTIRSSAVVRLGISQSQPCPTCDGDGAANDGNNGGTCNGGSRDGQSCDVNANHPTFGSVSYHCPPDGANISGAGLNISFTITGGSVSLPFNTQCDSPFTSYACACAVCSGDTSLPCNSDAECSAAGAGTCTSNGGGANRWPNSCADGVCTDGVCNAGPAATFCDGMLRANGGGILACQTDGDCQALNSECPGGDCGSCSLTEPRSCFTDPITAEGDTSQNGGDVVATFCTPPSNSMAINTAAGSPGPSRITVSMEFEGLCDDGSVAEPPAGSNCTSPANSWRAIYDSISSSCVGCHSSGAASGGLGGFEDAVSSYNALVGVTSGQSPSDLVEPGDSSLSYLVNKLEGTGSGAQMPSGGTLTAAQIQAVSDWIDSGASLN